MLATALLMLLLFLFAAILGTDVVQPALSSPCGRLKHLSFSSESLSMNHSRLVLPPGVSWQEIELRYELQPGEMLGFVVQRDANQLTALRLSRNPWMDEGLARYRNGILQTMHPVPTGGSEGTIRMQQNGRELRIQRDAGDWYTFEDPLPGLGEQFEVVLHPPSSVHLFDRVGLGNVVLENGDLLIPSWWARVRHSTPAFCGLIGILLAVSYRPLTYALRRLLPLHADKRPRDVVWLLVCLNLPFLALLGLPHVELMPVFDERTRIPFVMIVSLALVAGLAFGKLRDWVLLRFPGLQESWLSHRFLLPPVYLFYTVAWFVAFVLAFANLVIMQPRLVVDPAKGVTAGGTRILCVGGSVTRGAPFEEDGGVPSFPDLLEARLHGDGRRDATVFNRGVDAAGIGYIADHLPENLEQFRPTHLVVTAVANDFYRQPADYAVDVNRVLTQAKDFGVKQILLVKELEVDLVYGTARQNRSLYAVLDQAAARHGVTIVDPRPDFQAHRNEFLFMDWVHFTVRGNSLMADVIARQIDFD